jgi:hypothetical protein
MCCTGCAPREQTVMLMRCAHHLALIVKLLPLCFER